ncbi:MAG TPA: M20 family metallopeptidase [Desulfobacteria bacterium]|nr:M20 family metallopeptidase [Desulfobacteria bacterium]
MDVAKKAVVDLVNGLQPEIEQIATSIGQHPELGHHENYAVKICTEFLTGCGFTLIKGVGGLPTAFRAEFSRGNPGPLVAFLAEYDALPGIGHGCGHNLIGAASIGAAAALAKMADLPGTVLVMGTPAEETSGGKVTLTAEGLFEAADVAMMFHPGSQNVAEITSLALDAVQFEFIGKAAHAASAPSYGVNALDALINFFLQINVLKKQIDGDSRINGIITEGGVTPNIIPERAVARFYLRSSKRRNLDKLRAKVINCAEKAAAMVGARVTWSKFELSYDEMCTNRTLAGVFAKNLRGLGVNRIIPAQAAIGSVDMGNVSKVVPAIHPYLILGDGAAIPHTREFAEVALSEQGCDLAVLAAKALALTAWDVLTDTKLLQRIKHEFAQTMG